MRQMPALQCKRYEPGRSGQSVSLPGLYPADVVSTPSQSSRLRKWDSDVRIAHGRYGDRGARRDRNSCSRTRKRGNGTADNYDIWGAKPKSKVWGADLSTTNKGATPMDKRSTDKSRAWGADLIMQDDWGARAKQ